MYTNIIHNDDICNYFLKNQQFIFNSLGNCRECRWYMFGKRLDEDELLVYSLQNSAEIRVLDEIADPPEDFRLGEITSDFRKHFPVSDDLTDRDDRLQYLLASNQSMYKIF